MFNHTHPAAAGAGHLGKGGGGMGGFWAKAPVEEADADGTHHAYRQNAGPQATESTAFDELFARYARPVLSFLYEMVGDRLLAEDLAQETFIRSFRSISRKRNETPVSTWLFGVAHNVALEAVRRRRVRNREVPWDERPILDIADMRPCQDERLLNREIRGLIDRALAALPADHRSAFVLKVLHQLSYEEISAITGSSVSKLKTDLHRARHEMRRRLASLFETSVHGMEERS